MYRITSYLILAIVGLGTWSCTKTIEFDGETKEPKIVINSLFNTHDTFKVHISHSLALVDDGNLKPLKDAVVKVYDASNNLVATPLHDDKGIFTAPEFKPESGKTYTIKCENSGYKSVSASDVVPSEAVISEIDTQTVSIIGGGSELQIACTINDPKGENFYMVKVRVTSEWKIDSQNTERYSYYAWINTLDPNVDGSVSADAVYGEQLVFSDDNFDGRNYKFRFNTDAWIFNEGGTTKLNIEFYSMSEAAYNYFVSLAQYQNTIDNPFATPVQVYSNVEGGFGIFGGASVNVIPLK